MAQAAGPHRRRTPRPARVVQGVGLLSNPLPGPKLFTACMFFHKDQGIGKTMLVRVITSLYGDKDGSTIRTDEHHHDRRICAEQQLRLLAQSAVSCSSRNPRTVAWSTATTTGASDADHRDETTVNLEHRRSISSATRST